MSEFKSNTIYIILGATLVLISVVGLFFPILFSSFFSDDSDAEKAASNLPTFEDQFVAQGEDITASSSGVELLNVKDRLVISSAKINMPVFFGDNEKILNKGGWLYNLTSRPELGGNSVIFGHRFKYLPPVSNTLYNLDKVEIGDEMVLTWQGKEYKYKVFDKKIIEPTDISVIYPSSDSILTVITCTPLFSTKQRLVVVGSLVSPD